MAHYVYGEIIKVIKKGKLKEPFTISELKKACPHLNKNTCDSFPSKHSVGNPGNNSELFERTTDGKYRLVRPIKYGF